MDRLSRVSGTVRKGRSLLEGSVFSKIYNTFVSTSRYSRETLVDLACVIGVLPEASCQRGTIIDETVGAADVCQL